MGVVVEIAKGDERFIALRQAPLNRPSVCA